jgi:hypothetical protein
MATILADAVDILTDQTGHIAYLQTDTLWEYDITDTTVVGGSITFNNSDLGYPDIDKLIDFLDVDYEGAFNLSFYADGGLQKTLTFADKSTRGTVWRDYPLATRQPFQKLRLYVTSATADTKIYGIEIDFSILKRRRYN